MHSPVVIMLHEYFEPADPPPLNLLFPSFLHLRSYSLERIFYVTRYALEFCESRRTELIREFINSRFLLFEVYNDRSGFTRLPSEPIFPRGIIETEHANFFIASRVRENKRDVSRSN